ncbi:MAG: hypothetical protein BWY04_00685 [candidate division CPR1 bacterium ADurb.Bin160]|uniref:Uncharacterized protein n=1 Tax=candidate division CPR1 bacterium ADurb.Bin160 TaxID=1852826 RepID=A0A1V5ZN82_9BACT|nr:MAG: hypothetical protein BWY04_00685 [candidate division CPR1 bacterium ADurb.Bin160]
MQLQKIIGLPPSTYISDSLMLNSMPVLEFTPCYPEMETGLTLFSLKEEWQEYESLLEKHGFSLSEKPLKLAFLAENLPADSFSNDYGESFLDKLTDVVSSGAAEISQIFGSRNVKETYGKISSILSESGGVAGMVGGGMDTAVEQAKSFFEKAEGGFGSRFQGVGDLVSGLLAGARIDFPQIWKNSVYNPSYSFNIRLFNPNPGNKTATEKYIIGPLAAILLLGLPITEDGSTYNWPFLHKVYCKGLFHMDPAFITNITVTKGGEQQLVSYNQRLSIVDVRIDIGSLFGSILAGKQYESKNRPTLENYLNILKEERKIESVRGNPQGSQSSSPTSDLLKTNPSVARETETEKGISPRVGASEKGIYDTLKTTQPSI